MLIFIFEIIFLKGDLVRRISLSEEKKQRKITISGYFFEKIENKNLISGVIGNSPIIIVIRGEKN